MTTTIKVMAHCASDTEVSILRYNEDGTFTQNIIQDGQEFECYAYDNIEYKIKEIKKAI